MGPFKIAERKEPVAYWLAFPDSLRRMHDVFQVSVLRHYISDPTHVIDMSSLQVSDEGVLMASQSHPVPSHSIATTLNSRSGQGLVGQL
jgi:hypothetical protein